MRGRAGRRRALLLILLLPGCSRIAATTTIPDSDAPPSKLPAKPPRAVRDLYADTWGGVDALGRTMPTAGDGAPSLRKDRFVGVFYFINHGSAAKLRGEAVETDDPRIVFDNTKLLAQMAGDRSKYASLYRTPAGYFWAEPAVGYYLSDDPWVARHDLAMLADAGVDALFFDVTNGPTFPSGYLAICEAAEAMRKEGNPTPQIAFVTHAHGGSTTKRLYDEFYAKKLYPDLWFRWQGKPLLLGDPDAVQDDGKPLPDEVKRFFTWRRSWAYTPRPGRDGNWFGDGRDRWPWLDDWPQGFGWHDDPKRPEEAPVTIAGHPIESLGRSYRGTWAHGGAEPPVDKYDETADTPKGIYFDQQWKRALELGPSFVFVTGWNEWTAASFVQAPPVRAVMANRALEDGQFYFVDQYNKEFSRDAMPMKGGFSDNYFLQLAQNVRRYKGARPAPRANGFHTLTPSTPFAAWDRIQPEYRDAAGDTVHRDWPGWGGQLYKNDTGRNDIVAAKVACDAKSVVFYVRARAPLTPRTDPNWMRLLIDADRNPRTGWNGYDVVVNDKPLSATRTTARRLSDGKVWTVTYRVQGDRLVVAVPRAALGLTDAKQRIAFDFHWADNVPVGSGADPASWWYDGDSAPDGRFNYRFQAGD